MFVGMVWMMSVRVMESGDCVRLVGGWRVVCGGGWAIVNVD